MVQSPPNNLEILGRSPEQYCRPLSSVASISRRGPGIAQISTLFKLHPADSTVRGGFGALRDRVYHPHALPSLLRAYVELSTFSVRLRKVNKSVFTPDHPEYRKAICNLGCVREGGKRGLKAKGGGTETRGASDLWFQRGLMDWEKKG